MRRQLSLNEEDDFCDILSKDKARVYPYMNMILHISSVAQSCPTLCDPMDCRVPGLPITNSWSLPKLMSIESVMPPNNLILCSPLLLLPSISPTIRIFQMSQLCASGGQNIGVSASPSVLPMNIQHWFPLG